MVRPLSGNMRKAMREMVQGEKSSASRATYAALESRGITNTDGVLTSSGWKQAVVMLPLKKQCKALGIDYEKISGLDISCGPEYAVWRYLSSTGYVGAYCEGGPVLLLIKAAALEVLSELNLFGSREDACQRFTEAQLTIHENSYKKTTKYQT